MTETPLSPVALRAFFLLVAVAAMANAHSFMTGPDAYNRRFKTRYCKEDECTAACPNEYRSGMSNTADKPATVWERGAKVMVKWAKNNHNAGFFRLALVPLSVQYDRTWHKRFAFYYGCWETGAVRCKGEKECGTDRKRISFQREVTVPDVFPDGRYVLGVTWYGGVRHGDREGFQDFYSCSHVHINGGVPLGKIHVPVFVPGKPLKPGDGVWRGRCKSMVNQLGICSKLGCSGLRPKYMNPKIENKGVTPELVEQQLMKPRAAFKFRNGREKHRYQLQFGICRGNICCAGVCLKCGGPGCTKRRGGARYCCMGVIAKSGRICSDTVRPPCIKKS